MLRIRFTALSVCLAALVVITAGALLYGERAGARSGGGGLWGAPSGAASKEGERLPAHSLMSLERREAVGDELHKGRVLIVYLTTSCKACIKEAEIIARLQRDAPPGLRIYGVAIEGPTQVEAFAKEFNLTFPFLIDNQSRLARALNIERFPSKYFVQDGVITKVWRGLTPNPNELRQQLDIE